MTPSSNIVAVSESTPFYSEVVLGGGHGLVLLALLLGGAFLLFGARS